MAVAPLRQFVTFVGIGLANTLIHALVLAIAIEWLFWPLLLGHLIGFLFANMLSYVLNSRFTFFRPLALNGYLRFVLASLFSLLFTLLISATADWARLNYWYGFLLVIFLVPIFSFTLMKWWAFK